MGLKNLVAPNRVDKTRHRGNGVDQARENLDFADHKTLYATHALHPFAAKCPPQLARWAIEKYSELGNIILDPMVGGGTTMVEARLLGRQCFGIDMDPLARLISKVKSTPLPLDDLSKAIKLLLEEFNQECERWDTINRREEYNGIDVDSLGFPRLPNLDYWFLPEVKIKLALLKRCIKNLDTSSDIKDFFFVAFSSLIIAKKSVANARDVSHSRHHYFKHEAPPDVSGLFRRRLSRMEHMMRDFVDAYTQSAYTHTQIKIIGTDARAIKLPDDSVDLIFTSPPYCNAIDYPRAHRFSIAWLTDILGITLDEYAKLAKKYIGAERNSKGTDENDKHVVADISLVKEIISDVEARDRVKGKMVLAYFEDMFCVLKEMSRVLKPNKRLVLVVCPSHIRKIEVPSHKVFIEMGKHHKLGNGYTLRCEQLIERTMDDRRRLLPYMRAAFGERMRTEYVIVLRKTLLD